MKYILIRVIHPSLTVPFVYLNRNVFDHVTFSYDIQKSTCDCNSFQKNVNREANRKSKIETNIKQNQ